MQIDDKNKLNVQKPVEDLEKMTQEELKAYLALAEQGKIDESNKEEAKKIYLKKMVKDISRSNSSL